MVNRYLLLVLLTKLRLFNFETVALQKQILTRELDLSKLIEFPYEQQCLQIALDVKHQPRFSLVVPDNIPILVRSHLSLQLRDIGTEQEGQCQTFLIFAENIEIVKQIFKPDQTRAKQFFPFTKIYFHLDNPRNYTSNLESMSLARKFLTENALFGYVFEFNDGGNESKVSVKDLLTNDVISPVASYIPKDLLHPFVNTALVKDNFRISSFNCSPYNTYPASSNEKTLIDGMDGTEFRLVREVTRNWKKTFKFRDFSKVKSNPYVSILLDLSNKSSDISFCALWLIEDIYKQFDLSTFYEEQCLLLVVPKPRKLHEATAIYTTLDRSVWLLFLFFFLLATTLLNAIAKAEKRLNESNSIFTDLTNTVMEAISTATSHSVVHFPTDQTSVKILLTSWIILSMLLGISYTTIYASRLASPSYEKPINTVRQIVENGLSICNAYFDISTMEPFLASSNPDYKELANRSIVYGENTQQRRRLFVERKCAIFEVRFTKYYLSLLKFEADLDLLPLFRTINNCITNHYTGFVFQKYSPFTKLFNWHIRRYQEHGINKKWHSEILQTPEYMKTIFQDFPEGDKSHHSIAFISVSGAFFLLGTGLFVSSVAFFVEYMPRVNSRNA